MLGRGRVERPGCTVLFTPIALALLASAAQADLAGTLHRFVERNGSVFSNAIPDPLTPVLQRLAAQGTDLPPTATALGYTWRFDEEDFTGAGVRETGPLGSIFLDRPRTLGRHTVALALLYEHIELADFEGRDLASQIRLTDDFTYEDGSRLTRRLDFTDLTVTSDFVNLLATVGLGDRWDFSVLLPIATTTLDVAADKRTVARNVGEPREADLTMPSVSDAAAGFGDILVRSKWELASEPVAVGAVLGLRAPTGSEKDFRGLGDWIVQTDLLLARNIGPHEIHATLGAGLDADDLERSYARYGIGGSVQPLTGFAFFADVLGRSTFTEDEFDVVIPNLAFVESEFLDRFRVGSPELVHGGFRVTERVPRTDIVDVHVGFKWNPTASAFLFAGALVPITRDGFRAAVVPTAGAQWLF